MLMIVLLVLLSSCATADRIGLGVIDAITIHERVERIGKSMDKIEDKMDEQRVHFAEVKTQTKMLQEDLKGLKNFKTDKLISLNQRVRELEIKTERLEKE